MASVTAVSRQLSTYQTSLVRNRETLKNIGTDYHSNTEGHSTLTMTMKCHLIHQIQMKCSLMIKVSLMWM